MWDVWCKKKKKEEKAKQDKQLNESIEYSLCNH